MSRQVAGLGRLSDRAEVVAQEAARGAGPP